MSDVEDLGALIEAAENEYEESWSVPLESVSNVPNDEELEDFGGGGFLVDCDEEGNKIESIVSDASRCGELEDEVKKKDAICCELCKGRLFIFQAEVLLFRWYFDSQRRL